MERWHDFDPKQGGSPSQHYAWGSLESTEYATQEHFAFDEYWHRNGVAGDEALIKRCQEKRPDMIFLLWVPVPPHMTPAVETLNILRNKLSIPIVALHTDAIWPEQLAWAEQIAPYMEISIIQSHHTWIKDVKDPRKHMTLWPVQDPRVFYNPRLARNIDLSFLGAMSDYARHPERWDGLRTLKEAGIPVYHRGGVREDNIPVSDYARIFMYSKISLNFSQVGPYHAPKGRIFEMGNCGAMMMEPFSPETLCYFIPMMDYVPYYSLEDLLDKVRFYLKHDSEREEIAERMYEKATTIYSAKRYWKFLIERATGKKLV